MPPERTFCPAHRKAAVEVTTGPPVATAGVLGASGGVKGIRKKYKPLSHTGF